MSNSEQSPPAYLARHAPKAIGGDGHHAHTLATVQQRDGDYYLFLICPKNRTCRAEVQFKLLPEQVEAWYACGYLSLPLTKELKAS